MAYLQTFLSSASEIGADLLVLSGLHLLETQTETVRNNRLQVSSNEKYAFIVLWGSRFWVLIPINITYNKSLMLTMFFIVTARHGCQTPIRFTREIMGFLVNCYCFDLVVSFFLTGTNKWPYPVSR